jgi:peptide/nickel transport system ATP-binding protein/oligopeptide transport system ATP-binding protein
MTTKHTTVNETGLSKGKALPVLEVQDLTKRFEIRQGLFSRVSGYVHAVENVSFSINPGQTLGLVGESGCGKTTVGRLILKLIEPTEGSIRLENRDITTLSPKMMRPIRRQIQIIFQDPYGSLNPRMSAGKLVGEPLIIHGLASGKELKDRVATIFEQVGLRPDQLERYPHEFSGGQRQRLSIARALSVNPKLIIADEAVSALDVSIQASVINLLMDLQQEYNLSYLFIAHDIAVVEYISDYVAVMYLGKIVEMTSRKAIFTNPLHPYTEALLSAVPIPNPKAKKSKRILLKGDIPSPINPPKGCRFHTRCPYVMDVCRVEEPVFREVQPEHFVACHLR